MTAVVALAICALGAGSATAATPSIVQLEGSADAYTGDTGFYVLVQACPATQGALLTGTVQLWSGATLIATLPVTPIVGPPVLGHPCGTGPWVGSNAYHALPGRSPGTYTYTAVYSGDANYVASTSTTLTVVVPPRPSPTPTITQVDGGTNPYTGDTGFYIAIQACPAFQGALLTGTVQLWSGPTLVTTLPVTPIVGPPPLGHPCGTGPWVGSSAYYTRTGMSPGTYTFIAVYSGDANYLASTSTTLTVVVPPHPAATSSITTLTGNADPSTGDLAFGFVIQACPAVQGAQLTGSVQLWSGTTLVTTLPLVPVVGPPLPGQPCGNGPWVGSSAYYTRAGMSPGTYTFRAVYSGDANYVASSSAPLTMTVTQIPAIPPAQSFSGATSTLSGNASVQLSGGGSQCAFTNAAFIPLEGNANSPPAGSAPPSLKFPDGLVAFVARGCVPGSTITFTMTFPPSSRPLTGYWKYGPTPGNTTAHWYQIPASVAGNVVTFSIVDGGLGDDDLVADGAIADAGGPVADAFVPVPALGEWSMAMLALLVAWLGIAALRRPVTARRR